MDPIAKTVSVTHCVECGVGNDMRLIINDESRQICQFCLETSDIVDGIKLLVDHQITDPKLLDATVKWIERTTCLYHPVVIIDDTCEEYNELNIRHRNGCNGGEIVSVQVPWTEYDIFGICNICHAVSTNTVSFKVGDVIFF